MTNTLKNKSAFSRNVEKRKLDSHDVKALNQRLAMKLPNLSTLDTVIIV